MEDNRDRFTFDTFKSPETVIEARRNAMNKFLSDYEDGKGERYIPGDVRDLDFNDDEFDLAVSSHFLFLYDEKLTLDFHMKAIKEITRVTNELRIFPLTNMNGEESKYLNSVINKLSEHKYDYEIRQVSYEFQKDSSQMLTIFR